MLSQGKIFNEISFNFMIGAIDFLFYTVYNIHNLQRKISAKILEKYINFCSLLDEKDCESVCKELLLLNIQEKKSPVANMYNFFNSIFFIILLFLFFFLIIYYFYIINHILIFFIIIYLATTTLVIYGLIY